MSSVEVLRDQALTLPAHERAALAALLLASLDEASCAEDVAQAVIHEAESRAAAYANGELGACDAPESIARLRQTLAERRRH